MEAPRASGERAARLGRTPPGGVSLPAVGTVCLVAFSIRRARPNDAADLARVHVMSWRETYDGLLPPAFLERMTSDETRERRARAWSTLLADTAQVTFVAEVNGRVAGFVNGGPPRDHPGYEAELAALYLLRAAQGRGLGAALFEAFVAAMVERHTASMALWVLDVNPTRAFYARMGGVEDGEKYEGIPEGTLREVRVGWRNLASSVPPSR